MVFIILLSNGLLLVHRVTVGFYIDLDLNVAELITEGFSLFFREFLGISLCTGGYHLQIEVVYSPRPIWMPCVSFAFCPVALAHPIGGRASGWCPCLVSQEPTFKTSLLCRWVGVCWGQTAELN